MEIAIAVGVTIGIIMLLLLVLVGFYNGLVQARNRVDNGWSQIDVQLKRRHDLIPNLVETAKGYMKHEADTFKSITEARSKALGANNIKDASAAEGQLGAALSQFLLTVENYPDLKANQNFLSLQEELSSTENKISFSRQNYNDQVLSYNNKTDMFPSNIVAGMCNFTKRDFFEIENKEERDVPKVSF
jgi:LemA protein